MAYSMPYHYRYARTMIEMVDTAVQLAQEAANTAQLRASKANNDDWVLYDDAMILAGEAATVAEHMAEIAEETGASDFVQLAQATHATVVAAADAQAIAGVETTALTLLGLFENPVFNGITFEDVPEYAVILPEGAAKKKPQPQQQGQAKKKPQQTPAKNTQQHKPKTAQQTGKTVAKSEPKGKSRGLWWTIAALIIALFLI